MAGTCLGVAIVGCGLIGHKRAQALGAARLVARADIVPERAQALAITIPGAVCAGLNRRPPSWHVPLGAVQFGAKLADSLLRCAGRENNPAQAMLGKYVEDVAVSGAKFQRELGFRPRYDLLSGWRQTLADRKSSGHL